MGKEKTRERLQSLTDNTFQWGNTTVINIGIAGGNPNYTAIGNLYRVNAIIDETSGRAFFPDILLRHELNEISLTTVSKGVTTQNDRYKGLVDMEAGAIFEVMSKFVPPHRLVFLKVVSDHMDTSDWKSINVTGLIENYVSYMKSLVNQFNDESITDRQVLTDYEIGLLHRGAAGLKLTVTQIHQLTEWSENYKKTGSDELEKLDDFFAMQANSKKERNEIFNAIRRFLSA